MPENNAPPMTMSTKVLLTFAIPPAGFVLGCIEWAHGRGPQGALLFLLGFVTWVVYMVILAALGL